MPQNGITVEAWITYDDTTLPTGWRYPMFGGFSVPVDVLGTAGLDLPIPAVRRD